MNQEPFNVEPSSLPVNQEFSHFVISILYVLWSSVFWEKHAIVILYSSLKLKSRELNPTGYLWRLFYCRQLSEVFSFTWSSNEMKHTLLKWSGRRRRCPWCCCCCYFWVFSLLLLLLLFLLLLLLIDFDASLVSIGLFVNVTLVVCLSLLLSFLLLLFSIFVVAVVVVGVFDLL